MDIRLAGRYENFKFRVGAIIKNNGKFLVCKINNNDFYCLVGGHVQVNESTEEAVVREVKEELCIDVKITSLACIFENFFVVKSGKKYHELCFAYEVEPVEEIEQVDYKREEVDNGGKVLLDFKWLTLDEMESCFKPKALLNAIKEDCFKHLIIRQG